MKFNEDKTNKIIEKLQDIQDDFMNNLIKEQTKNCNNMIAEFLTENGYKIEKPYNIEQIKEIKEDLRKQDKFVDIIEYTEFLDNTYQAYHYLIPFFNSISNPLSENTKQQLAKEYLAKRK
jgi:predicted SpoU family rRNA methylase